MLREALTYVRRGDHAEGAFLTGVILSFLVAILAELWPLVVALLAVVPAVALAGYFARVLVTSTNGESDPPAFPLSAGLFRDGLLALVAAGPYVVIPVVILLLSVGGALSGGPATRPDFVTSMRIYGGSAIAFVTALAFAYVAPAAVILAIRESIGSAFRPGSMLALVGHAAYFYAWTVALVFLGLGVSAAVALAAVPYVGEALAVFVGFYVLVTGCRLVGRGCARSLRNASRL